MSNTDTEQHKTCLCVCVVFKSTLTLYAKQDPKCCFCPNKGRKRTGAVEAARVQEGLAARLCRLKQQHTGC